MSSNKVPVLDDSQTYENVSVKNALLIGVDDSSAMLFTRAG